MNTTELLIRFTVPPLMLGCGSIGGVFFAFPSFVMKALARLAPAQGIAAMQSINVVVLNPWFLGPFLGTAVACALVTILSLLQWQPASSAWLVAGAVLYLVGTLTVTMLANVPRNEALAALDPHSAGSAKLWAEYSANGLSGTMCALQPRWLHRWRSGSRGLECAGPGSLSSVTSRPANPPR